MTLASIPVQVLLFAIVMAVAAAGAVAGLSTLRSRKPVERRLQAMAGQGAAADGAGTRALSESLARAAQPLARFAASDDGWETQSSRLRFLQAGLRDPDAPLMFFAAKTLLAIVLPLLAWAMLFAGGARLGTDETLLVVVSSVAAGFYLPNWFLKRRIAARQLEILEQFPDALDLMTTCVEAGLSLDSAVARVAGEVRATSDVLAEELELVSLEWRAGGGRERALRNLSMRTGVNDIEMLVSMLVQSEKLGTGVAETLRTNSKMLRSKRQQRAEEAAAKVSVKLVFPLVLFIFPSILIVVAGPAMLQIGKALSTAFGGE